MKKESTDMDAGGLSGALLTWYDENRRSLPWRDDPSPYHVWISEIMLQQTRVEAVKGYYARFLQRFPDIRSLAEAPEDECMKLWEGLGYYSRARNLLKAAGQVMDRYGGEMPQTAAELRKLAGIGPYTSAAIASIAFGERVPAVDGNLLRIFARLALYEEDVRTPAAAAAARDYFLTQMPPDRPGDFNQALMDLGSAVCTPGRPACLQQLDGQQASHGTRRCSGGDAGGPAASIEKQDGRCELPGFTASAGLGQEGRPGICPLARFCGAFRAGRCEELPVMPVKKARAIEERTVLVIRDHDRVLLQRRPSRGLLAGLYEFPNYEGRLGEDEALEKARAFLPGCGSTAPDVQQRKSAALEKPRADTAVHGRSPNDRDKLRDRGAIREVHVLSSRPLHLRPLPEAKHVFTHKEWHMRGYEIRVGSLYAPRDMAEAVEPAAGSFPPGSERLQQDAERPIRSSPSHEERGTAAAGAAAAGSVSPGGAPARGKAFFAPLRELEDKYAIPSAFAAYMPHKDI